MNQKEHRSVNRRGEIEAAVSTHLPQNHTDFLDVVVEIESHVEEAADKTRIRKIAKIDRLAVANAWRQLGKKNKGTDTQSDNDTTQREE